MFDQNYYSIDKIFEVKEKFKKRGVKTSFLFTINIIFNIFKNK